MVSLLCDVQAYPPPEIAWTRDGQLLQFSTGVHILPGQDLRWLQHFLESNFGTYITLFNLIYLHCMKGGQMLQLPRARLEDAGQYVCTASNSAGQDQKSFLLNVYGERTPHDPSAALYTHDRISKQGEMFICR